MRKYLYGITAALLIAVPIDMQKAEASSNTNQTPTLNGYQINNHAKLEWAVEMLDEDILYQSGFESNDELPDLNYGGQDKAGGLYGGQSFTTEDYFSGTHSLRIEDTYTNGQHAGSPDMNGVVPFSNYSRSIFSKKFVENGTDLSVSFRAKTTGTGKITPTSYSAPADYGMPINVKFLENVKSGDTTAKVSDPAFFQSYIDKGTRYYIADRKGKYSYIYVKSVNMETATITVDRPFRGDFVAGDPVLKHVARIPVTFPYRTISNKDWELFNVNTKVANFEDFNTLINGFTFTLLNETRNIMYIDDLKMGYATRTELYRGNDVIYEGLLSDFEDTQATDKAKPNPISKYSSSKEGNKIYVQVATPTDQGTNYSYKVRAISKSGSSSFFSDVKTVNIKSGIKGYSFIIDKDPNSTPKGAINSSSGKIEIPIDTPQDSYLHIQAIDNAGNISDTAHFPLENIIDKKLELTVPGIEPFQTIILKEQPITYSTSFNSNFNVKNYYPGSGEGWRLSVSASPLKLVDSSYTLPKGTISLDPISSVKPVGEGIGNKPVSIMTKNTIIDNGNVTLVDATSGNGIGEYELIFPPNALKIVIDPTTAKKGKYQSTITWDLVSGP